MTIGLVLGTLGGQPTRISCQICQTITQNTFYFDKCNYDTIEVLSGEGRGREGGSRDVYGNGASYSSLFFESGCSADRKCYVGLSYYFGFSLLQGSHG